MTFAQQAYENNGLIQKFRQLELKFWSIYQAQELERKKKIRRESVFAGLKKLC